jgi:hypothetical protein
LKSSDSAESVNSPTDEEKDDLNEVSESTEPPVTTTLVDTEVGGDSTEAQLFIESSTTANEAAMMVQDVENDSLDSTDALLGDRESASTIEDTSEDTLEYEETTSTSEATVNDEEPTVDLTSIPSGTPSNAGNTQSIKSIPPRLLTTIIYQSSTNSKLKLRTSVKPAELINLFSGSNLMITYIFVGCFGLSFLIFLVIFAMFKCRSNVTRRKMSEFEDVLKITEKEGTTLTRMKRLSFNSSLSMHDKSGKGQPRKHKAPFKTGKCHFEIFNKSESSHTDFQKIKENTNL